MKAAAEYRVMAEKCFKWARKTCPDDARETYRQLGQFWLDVAAKLDGPARPKQKSGLKLWLARARYELLSPSNKPRISLWGLFSGDQRRPC